MSNHKQIEFEEQLETTTFESTATPEFTSDDEALSAARAAELNNSFRPFLPKGYFFGEDGWLYYQKEDTSENPPEPLKICSRLVVAARTRDQFGENHGRLLQFTDLDGIVHEWAMPMQLLAGDSAAYREVLLSKGLLINISRKARDYLTSYIQDFHPEETVRCVDQTGWNEERTAFVFRDKTIGKASDEQLILQTTANLPTTRTVSGGLADWQQIAALCKGNSRLIFAVSAAFAPPLLLLTGTENGGVHFRGGSSSGKTTCLRAAASVWGGTDYLQQWRATANGLEGIAAAYNDCLLCLDEMGQIDPHELGNVAYMLANGVGKTRANKVGDSRKQKLWRLLFLSSGEIALSDHMLTARQRARAGQEVRVLDIPADGQTYGCFQELHGFENGKDFSENLGDLCKTYYGTPGRLFVEMLLPVQSEVAKNCKNLIDQLNKKYVPARASGQVHRAFNRFALIAVAGELATSFGITGWVEGDAIGAAISCFNDWLKVRGDLGPQEERAILSQVRHFFEQHAESRFTPWHEESNEQKNSKTINRVGYRKICSDKGDEEFYVFRESFKKDIAEGHDAKVVAQVCLKHGLLMEDPKRGATRSERLPGSKANTRVYRFTSKVLIGEGGENEID